MLKNKVFIGVLLIEFFAIVAMIGHGLVCYYFEDQERLAAKQDLVLKLGLTDCSIWTEVRYTRHPSLADYFSAFQDFSGSFEHFPAGAIIALPLLFQEEIE
jgi:hypothetical protein